MPKKQGKQIKPRKPKQHTFYRVTYRHYEPVEKPITQELEVITPCKNEGCNGQIIITLDRQMVIKTEDKRLFINLMSRYVCNVCGQEYIV